MSEIDDKIIHIKDKGGRPTEYTEEVLEALAKNLREWVDMHIENDELHLLGDWCIKNNFSKCNFKRYCSKNQAFKEAHAYAKSWQEHQVAKGALTKKYDPRFSQFFLACLHGWRIKDDGEARKQDLRNDFNKFLSAAKGEDSEDSDD